MPALPRPAFRRAHTSSDAATRTAGPRSTLRRAGQLAVVGATAAVGALAPLGAAANAATHDPSTVYVPNLHVNTQPGQVGHLTAAIVDTRTHETIPGASVEIQQKRGPYWAHLGEMGANDEGWVDVPLRANVPQSMLLRLVFHTTASHAQAISAPVAFTTGDPLAREVLAEAASLNGSPYVFGASGPRAFDCSGFTQFVFGKVGKAIPRTTWSQYAAAHKVAKSQVKPGDLIFFGSDLHHVAIYAGGGKMWDAPHTGDHVRERAIYSSDWRAATFLH